MDQNLFVGEDVNGKQLSKFSSVKYGHNRKYITKVLRGLLFDSLCTRRFKETESHTVSVRILVRTEWKLLDTERSMNARAQTDHVRLLKFDLYLRP